MTESIKCKAYVTSCYFARQEFIADGEPGLIEPPIITLCLESKSLTEAVGSDDPAVVNKALASITAAGAVIVTLEATPDE